MFLTVGCSATPTRSRSQAWDAPPSQRRSSGSRVSGIIGVTDITALNLELDPAFGSTTRDDGLSMPMIGAQGQVVNRSGRLEWGFEGGFSLGWDSDREAVVIDTGTVLVLADNNMRIFDLSGGLFVGTTTRRGMRIYAGAGPLLQYGHIDLDLGESINGRGSLTEDGLGFGYYSRAGVEIETSPGTTVGFVVRWVDSSIDFGGAVNELDMEAVQIGFVMTTGF
ncbi:MAG: opacity protein-like surface antigen [Chlamydiales bacterium]|jgi:opacity protein-like surface antigen